MEDPREVTRLEKKIDVKAVIGASLKPLIEDKVKAGIKKMSILDVGCGTGIIALELAKNFPDYRVDAVDINSLRFKKNKEKNKTHFNLNFYLADASHLPFDSDSYDIAFTRFLLEYIKKPENVIKEMIRVVRPGGYVLLQDLDGQLLTHYPYETEFKMKTQAIIKYLAKTGFDPFVGRKLFYLVKRNGLKNISVKIEPYHLYAGRIDAKNYKLWDLKLKIAFPHIAKALGSIKEADNYIKYCLNFFLKDDTLTFSNLFTVLGVKPLN